MMNNYDERKCSLYLLLNRLDKLFHDELLLADAIADAREKANAQAGINYAIRHIQTVRLELTDAFALARTGDDGAKYALANMLYSMVISDGFIKMPDGISEQEVECAQKEAFRHSLEICTELASRNHPEACLWAASMNYWGDGCDQDTEKARALLDKAESLGINTPHSQWLREQIGPSPKPRPPVSKPPKP